MARLILKMGREKSLKRRHLWIFSGAVERLEGEAKSGDVVEVCDASGKYLATASYSASSQITARVWTFDRNEAIDGAFFFRRIREAFELRKSFGCWKKGGACRLVASEGDGVSALVVDKYADTLVAQFGSAGVERFKPEIVEALRRLEGVKSIYERSDLGVRRFEDLPESSGLLWGEEPPERVDFEEDGCCYQADVRRGHKTGFYLDQRENRRLAGSLAGGKRVLNVFSYTGGFSISCMKGGASAVVNIDSSREALLQAERHLELNGIPTERVDNLHEDAFSCLRRMGENGEKFDMVILDPPKLIDGASSLTRGCRAYKDLARLGFSLLKHGGLLMNFSCSGLMTPELFQKITADGALDAGVEARILRRLGQGADHPVLLAVPESFYLKGLLCVCK